MLCTRSCTVDQVTAYLTDFVLRCGELLLLLWQPLADMPAALTAIAVAAGPLGFLGALGSVGQCRAVRLCYGHLSDRCTCTKSALQVGNCPGCDQAAQHPLRTTCQGVRSKLSMQPAFCSASKMTQSGRLKEQLHAPPE